MAASGRRRGACALVLMGLLAALALPAGPVVAQDTSAAEIPENARARGYGTGWVCETGFREANGACDALFVPENAYLTDTGYGRGWNCRWGFREQGQRCEQIVVPAHGYLNAYGDGWKCLRGYLEVTGACEKVQVPENGFYSDNAYSSGWECERGYRASRQECLLVEVPENAHLDFSGHEWDCDPPYRKQGSACIRP
ncbi:MAG: hypothetical protein RIB84_15075 [Sneathiellaceae bacterium]